MPNGMEIKFAQLRACARLSEATSGGEAHNDIYWLLPLLLLPSSAKDNNNGILSLFVSSYA